MVRRRWDFRRRRRRLVALLLTFCFMIGLMGYVFVRCCPVMTAFVEEASTRNLNNVVIEQTGCIGMCALEPIVEVYVPGKEKVTYVKVTAEKVAKIVSDHIVNGAPVVEYTVGAQK